jgi:hypothetical protein
MLIRETRPLTPQEREILLAELRRRMSEPPVLARAAMAGCFAVPVGCAGVVAFGFGAGLGLLVALASGNWARSGDFAVWFGLAAGAAGAAVMLGAQLKDAFKERQDRRRIVDGTADLGQVRVLEATAERGVWIDAFEDGSWPVYVLPAGEDELGVLAGSYLNDLAEKHGFPHQCFRIVRSRDGFLLGYDGRDGKPDVERRSGASLTEEEREAVQEALDESVVPGRLEDCITSLLRYRPREID